MLFYCRPLIASVAATSPFMQLAVWPSPRPSCSLCCGHRLAFHATCAVAIASPFMQLALWPLPRLSCCLRCGHRLAFHAACAVAIVSPFMQLALWPLPRLSCNLRCDHRLALHFAPSPQSLRALHWQTVSACSATAKAAQAARLRRSLPPHRPRSLRHCLPHYMRIQPTLTL